MGWIGSVAGMLGKVGGGAAKGIGGMLGGGGGSKGMGVPSINMPEAKTQNVALGGGGGGGRGGSSKKDAWMSLLSNIGSGGPMSIPQISVSPTQQTPIGTGGGEQISPEMLQALIQALVMNQGGR